MNEDELIAKILHETKTLAVVGLSPKEHRAAHIVARFLQGKGYKIIPVYPREERILGEKVYRNLTGIKEPVDTVVVFRRSEEVMEPAQQAVKLKPKYFWMQLGIENTEAEKLLKKNGISVIMDRCMKIEYAANM